MRKDIEFKTENGVTLRGWHYVPDGRQGKAPTIVMRSEERRVGKECVP